MISARKRHNGVLDQVANALFISADHNVCSFSSNTNNDIRMKKFNSAGGQFVLKFIYRFKKFF